MNHYQSNCNSLINFISKNEIDLSKEKKDKNKKNRFSSTKDLINNFNIPKRTKNINSFFNPFNNNTDYLIKNIKNSLGDNYKFNSHRISIQNDNTLNENVYKLPIISKNENNILQSKKIKLKK